MKLRYVITLVIFQFAFSAWYIKQRMGEEYLRGFTEGMQQIKVQTIDHDTVCPAWFFRTNLKEARRRICTRNH